MGNCFGSSASAEPGAGRGRARDASADAKRKKKGVNSRLDKQYRERQERIKTKVKPQDIEFGFTRNFHEEYEVTKLLGKGAFASVYQVAPREGSAFFGRSDLAVKVVAKTALKNLQEVEWLRQEIEVMKILGASINIVHIYECFESRNHVYILMELCSGGNLFEKVTKGELYSEKMASVLMEDILRVAQQCHAKDIVHRDIKPENFIFGNKFLGAPLKMADFGLADYCADDQRLKEISGTPYYIAPEVVRQSYAKEADIWSCGVLMYFLLTGRTPFHKPNDNKQSYKIVFRRILEEQVDFSKDPWPNISDSAKDLCRKLLNKNAEKRLTASEALEHPWIQRDSPGSETTTKQKALVQRLQLFGTYSKFKQVVLYRIAKELAHPELEELKKTWDNMNIGNVERMGTVRLLDGLEMEGYTVGEVEGSNMLKRIDVLDGGEMTFEVFSAAILDWREIGQDKKYEQLCRQVFDQFDHKRDGFITADEIRDELSEMFTDKELAAMISEADTNGDEKITFEEFLTYIQEKVGSADMFDKRLTSRYRNSFPRRTSSFLRLMNLEGAAAAADASGGSANLSTAGSSLSHEARVSSVSHDQSESYTDTTANAATTEKATAMGNASQPERESKDEANNERKKGRNRKKKTSNKQFQDF